MSEDTFQAATMRKLRELEREKDRLRIDNDRLRKEIIKLEIERMKRDAEANNLYRWWKKQQAPPVTKWTQS